MAEEDLHTRNARTKTYCKYTISLGVLGSDSVVLSVLGIIEGGGVSHLVMFRQVSPFWCLLMVQRS